MLRMFLSRTAGTETLGVYMMILPMISLLINVSQAGVPSALFTLTADPKTNHKKLFLSSAILCSFQMGLCYIIIFAFHRYFATIQPYLWIILIFIFIACISALLRSYHLGKEQAQIPALSQVIEEIVRMSVIGLLYFKNSTLTLNHVFLAMLLGEASSCLFMLARFNTRQSFPALNSFKDLWMYKEILSISIPVSGTQLIHSFCHSLEPLIYRHFLLKDGYSLKEINSSYGVLNGCVLSLLMIPTFLNTVIYRIILPKITQSLDNKKRTQTLMIQSMIICVLMGLPFSMFFYFFPDFSLNLLFDSTQGANYLKYLAIPFLIYYLQTPLQAYLQASHLHHVLLINSLIQSIVSLVLLSVLLPLWGPFALAFCFLCGLLINTILSFVIVAKHLFFYKK